MLLAVSIKAAHSGIVAGNECLRKEAFGIAFVDGQTMELPCVIGCVPSVGGAVRGVGGASLTAAVVGELQWIGTWIAKWKQKWRRVMTTGSSWAASRCGSLVLHLVITVGLAKLH